MVEEKGVICLLFHYKKLSCSFLKMSSQVGGGSIILSLSRIYERKKMDGIFTQKESGKHRGVQLAANPTGEA